MIRVSTLLFVFTFFGTISTAEGQPLPTGREKKGKQVTFEGTLKHPVFAIGGETTGTVVETKKDGTYELDLGKNKDLLKQVEALKGKEVKVTGTLRVVKGVEIPERRLVTLQTLAEVKK